METVVSFENVSKKFGHQTAVDQVTFKIEPGSVFALLGENGAGKTTTIKTMMGFTKPDSGTVSVLGLNPETENLQLRRCVGFVPEKPQLYDWMKVGQIGWFAAGFYPQGFEANFQTLIANFEVDPRKKIGSLSKGMKAKVGLALALSHNPELLVLDEPTSGLDPMVRREFLESMVDRAATGKTIFLSSHQINEVERVADSIGLMKKGKLILVEPLEALKEASQEVSVTVTETGVPLPNFNGAKVSAERQGRQWKVLTRNVTKSQLDAVSDSDFVVAVDVRRPSLEEIFVGYLNDKSSYQKQNAENDGEGGSQ